MEFNCVYCKNRKKLDKYLKTNNIKNENRYIIDVNRILEEEEINFGNDRTYLKILIFNKIQSAIKKNKDIYYIPSFDIDFSIEKLLNLKKVLNENQFNVLVFYNEFRKNTDILDEIIQNLSRFSNSMIIRD